MTIRSAALCNVSSLLTRSPLVWPMVMFGVSGIAFTVANIIWARSLPATAYAVVALCVAIWNLALRFAPFGADLEVNRGRGSLTRKSIRRVTATSALAGVVSSAIARFGYDLSATVSIVLAIAVTAGGMVAYTAAALQARRRYVPSLALLHSNNYVVLAVAVATLVSGIGDVRVIVGAIALGTVLVLFLAALTLRSLLPAAGGQEEAGSAKTLLPLIAITGSAELLAQLDRLVTPLLLSLEDLARLSVLLALVGPPFRLLEMAVAYALLPELKSATDRTGVRRALQHMAILSAAMAALAVVGLLLVVAPLSHWLFGAQFALPVTLIAAVLASGLVRVTHGVAGAAATALVPEAKLSRLATLGVLSAMAGIAGATVGSRWGLQGVIYGSMAGWVFRSLGCAKLVRDALRHRLE